MRIYDGNSQQSYKKSRDSRMIVMNLESGGCREQTESTPKRHTSIGYQVYVCMRMHLVICSLLGVEDGT